MAYVAGRASQKHDELWVGFYKVGSGKPSITWPEAVDGALCFGWIDGVRKSLDESRYVIRFTPRRPKSIWSAVNIKRVAELSSLGLMRPQGMQAFERRTGNRSEIYAYEQRKGAALGGAYEKQFRANKKAWKFLSDAAGVVPKNSELVGDQRQKGRDAVEAAGSARSRIASTDELSQVETPRRAKMTTWGQPPPAVLAKRSSAVV